MIIFFVSLNYNTSDLYYLMIELTFSSIKEFSSYVGN